MASIVIKSGREKSLLRHHPWVFSGAIKEIKGSPQPGDTVDIFSSNGRWLARGAHSPHSQIAVRVWSFERDEEVSSSFFSTRIERAIQFRRFLSSNFHTTAYRLIYAESDGLPGLIVDFYNGFLVCQFLTAGSEFWREEIISQLVKLVPCKGIYERSDVDEREKEGLRKKIGVLYGEEPRGLTEIQESSIRFLVDLPNGHKTGFYLDQRENRISLSGYAQDREVLNCFSYSGGFGVWALKGGATRLVNMDSSAHALELAKRNFNLNGFDKEKIEYMEADVFKALRHFRESRRQFDLIVLDPPKFARSRSQLERACRGYKDINMLAFQLLRPGGLLFTFSCSAHMGSELFQKVVADGALDAGRDAQIIKRFSQAADHPVAVNLPESNYLKGLLLRTW
ncbi:MAG: class I SAM-dependent methyltransferase [Pseudomonadota bacterium]